jgi:hypothetical protein
MVSYDENGNRVETPWENLTQREKTDWYNRAFDRVIQILGYEKCTPEEIEAIKATPEKYVIV